MKQRLPAMIAIGAIFLFCGGWLLRGARDHERMKGQDLFAAVLAHIRQDYVDSIPMDSVFGLAAAGAVEQLNDPYSSLEIDEQYRALSEVTSGNYGGLGMQIDLRDGWITVVAPLPQTPAERAGVQAGDQIVEVNGKSMRGLTQEQAIKSLRGEVGTKAAIKVRRPGTAQLLPFTLTREVIHNRSTQPGTMLNDNIGYVVLSTISDSSGIELRDEVNGLLKQGMKGLILDLRENPGGLLTQGVSVSDLFLDAGRKIVSTKGRMADMNHQYTDGTAQLWPNLPLVVLVNEFSASAAEIIAGALQDNDRAVIVGTPTFGKGLVQTLWPFGEGTGLKLTTGRWYTPSGRTIQRTAKNQEDQIRIASSEAQQSGSWLDSLPAFKTVSGRTVKGGGGIVPDLVVRADTLSPGEREFVKGIGANVSVFRDALVAEALDVKEHHAVAAPGFAVTDAMRQGVLSRMKAKNVVLTADQLAGGSRLLDQQLAYEVERYAFGRSAELRRRAGDEAQVRAAIELFRNGTTQAALMSQVANGPTLK